MAEEQQYGGFWARFVALILDNAIVFVILLAAAFGMGMMIAVAGMDGMAGTVGGLLVTFVPFLYWPVMESSKWQATVGKRVMGLEVTDLEGNRLSFVHALLRAFGKIVSSIPFGIGFLIAAFTARKQALHDMIAKTLVVRTGPSQLWKIFLALIVGAVVMVASAVAIFYYVLMPMFKGGVQDMMKEGMKGAPQIKIIPPPAPAGKAPQPQARPAAPAPQAAMPAGKAGPDPEFDAIAGKPLEGLEKPNSTRAGPAILELSTFAGQPSVKAYVPLPALGDVALMPAPTVIVDRVLDSKGVDYFDANSAFEKDDFFRRPTLSQAKDPVPHLAGIRTVHLKPGLGEQALQKIEGQVKFSVPVDPRPVTFDAKETGKEKPVHDSIVSLQSVSGNAARLHFRGASENMLQVRGFGADGKPLALDSWQNLPKQRDVDDDFTITFKAAPARVEVVVAAKIIERSFPFSLARGAAAGAPATAAQGTTVPPRTRAALTTPAAAAAPAASPAPAAAPPKPEVKQAEPAAPMLQPKAEPKPKPVAAAPAMPREAARPAPRPAPEPPRPIGEAGAGCVYKPVMTDEEIARCR